MSSTNTQTHSFISIIPSSSLQSDRAEILKWAKEVNASPYDKHVVGGIVAIENISKRKCLKSITSGEVRWFPSDSSKTEEIAEIFEWANEEILCAFAADVPCLIMDPLGAEVLNSEGLDAGLRATVWKAREQASMNKMNFVIIADDEIVESFSSLYMFDDSEMIVLPSWEDWLNGPSLSSKIARRPKTAPPTQDIHDPYHHGIVRQIVRTIEGLYSKNKRIKQEMGNATSFTAWRRLARQLDVLEGKGGGSISHLPTLQTLAQKLHEFKNVILDKKAANPTGEHDLLRVLRECTMATQNDLITEHVYSMNNTGTNVAIQEYTDDIVDALEIVSKIDDPMRLNLRNWQSQNTEEAGEQTTEHASSGYLTNHNWPSPVKASIAALKKAPGLTQTESGKKLLEHLQKYESDILRKSNEISSNNDPHHFTECKRRYFAELAHGYGEVALCLSGGASNAYYHLGVIKCLLEKDILPRHITGASGGALVGSFLCTHTDQELKELLEPGVLSKIFNPCEAGMFQMLKNGLFGNVFDLEEWANKLQNQICGDLTFREAFERTGRSFTITVYNIDAKGRNHTRCLNYKTTPDVVVYSAVLASSALPKLLPAVELLRKDARGNVVPYHSFGKFWRDGSFENELPFEAIHQLFNTSFHLVSQVEPHIIPFFYENRGGAGNSVSHRKGKGWRGGFLLSYFERLLKLDLKKWLELVRDFHLLPKVMETDMSSIFLGRTRGSCTMAAPVILNSYVNLVRDPNTPKKMDVYLQAGKRMVFPKLGMLANHMKIERKLMELAGIDRTPIAERHGAVKSVKLI